MPWEEFGLVEWIYIGATIAILPAIIFGLIAQVKVSFAYGKYSKISTNSNKTAAQLAEEMLRENAVDCRVELGHGHLTDHYDPRTKSVVLSPEVYHGNSVAAYGIAAHEVGHAIQDATNYAPLKIRHAVVKGTNVINKLLLPIIIIGMIAQIFIFFDSPIMIYFIGALVIFYFLSFLISVITLPTEYNASNRAKEMLRQTNALDEKQQQGVRKVLSAAALTYLASLVISLVYFLRFASYLLILLNSGRKR
jgi:Zn-dependent membrane protease YugP